MSRRPKGTWLQLSPARRLIIEMLHHARKQPSIPVARAMNVGRLVELRSQLPDSPSWIALFLRAYGLTAVKFPELRRAFLPWPVGHLYEHPFSIGAVVVEREVDGEAVLLAAKIRAPEKAPLGRIQGHLRRFKTAPVAKVSHFRQLLRLARMPWLLRRFFFWQTLGWSGRSRAKRFGTFMLSSYGNLGAEQLHPLTPLTTLLTFGPISPGGDVNVKVVYDHRVMDGRRVALALAELERILRDDLPQELEVGVNSSRETPAGLQVEWLPVASVPG
jgi:hypothetical protein